MNRFPAVSSLLRWFASAAAPPTTEQAPAEAAEALDPCTAPDGGPLEEWCAGLVATHHAQVHAHLGRLEELLGGAACVHKPGSVCTGLADVVEAWHQGSPALVQELRLVLELEEDVLFPRMAAMAHAGPVMRGIEGCGVPDLVDQLEESTRDILETLDGFAKTTHDYRSTDQTCGRCARVLSVLAELDEELRRYAGVQRRGVFPRAAALAKNGR